MSPFVLLDVILKLVRGKLTLSQLFSSPRESGVPIRLSHPSLGKSKFVTLAHGHGRKLHYLESGSGPLMLCLHGFPESPYSWRYVSQAFSATHTVVAVELPGYGQTPRVEPSWAAATTDYGPASVLPTLRAFVAHLLETHSQEQIVLVGHDWGGMLAWAFASQYPRIVKRLVIMDLPHPIAMGRNMNWAQTKKSWYIAFFNVPRLPEAYLRMNDFAVIKAAFKGSAGGVKNRKWLDDDDVDAIKWSLSRAGTLTAALGYYRSVGAWGAAVRQGRRALDDGKLPMPVLQLHGADDAFLGVEQIEGTEKLCGAGFKLVVLPGASHWCVHAHHFYESAECVACCCARAHNERCTAVKPCSLAVLNAINHNSRSPRCCCYSCFFTWYRRVQQDVPEEVCAAMASFLSVKATPPRPLGELPST